MPWLRMTTNRVKLIDYHKIYYYHISMSAMVAGEEQGLYLTNKQSSHSDVQTVTVIIMIAIYMLAVGIGFINLLIAMFSDTYRKIKVFFFILTSFLLRDTNKINYTYSNRKNSFNKICYTHYITTTLYYDNTILRQHYITTTLYYDNTILRQHYITTTLYYDNTILRQHYITTTLYYDNTILRQNLGLGIY